MTTPDDLTGLAARCSQQGDELRQAAESVTQDETLRIDLPPLAAERIGVMLEQAAAALRALTQTREPRDG